MFATDKRHIFSFHKNSTNQFEVFKTQKWISFLSFTHFLRRLRNDFLNFCEKKKCVFYLRRTSSIKISKKNIILTIILRFLAFFLKHAGGGGQLLREQGKGAKKVPKTQCNCQYDIFLRDFYTRCSPQIKDTFFFSQKFKKSIRSI